MSGRSINEIEESGAMLDAYDESGQMEDDFQEWFAEVLIEDLPEEVVTKIREAWKGTRNYSLSAEMWASDVDDPRDRD